jgi:hypothetical protein
MKQLFTLIHTITIQTNLINMKLILLTILITIAFISCNTKQTKQQLQSTTASLAASNKFIRTNTLDLFEALKAKSLDPRNRERAIIWLAILDSVKNTTDVFIEKFEDTQATSNTNKAFYDSAFTNYINFLQNINPEIKGARFMDSAKIADIKKSIDKFSTQRTEESNVSHVEVIKNNIYLLENDIVEFANDKSRTITCGYEKFNSFISQNAMHFKKGDALEIMAGIGSFSTSAAPNIIINQSKIELNESGVAIFKKTLNENLGKYTIPVVISYTDPSGIERKEEKTIQYEVH